MPLEELKKEFASRRDQILVITGTGIACATDPNNNCNSWTGLLEHGRNYCHLYGYGQSPNWDSLVSGLIKERTANWLIAAATEIEDALRKVSAFSKWLKDSVGTLKVIDPCVIDAILSWNVLVATTNYDGLFEAASTHAGSPLPPILWTQYGLAQSMLRGDAGGILHLHGHCQSHDSVIFGAKSYETICRDERFQDLLRAAFTFKTVIFIGCGAGTHDPNLGGLLKWYRNAFAECDYRHYHLVLNEDVDKVRPLYHNNCPMVIPIGYGDDHKDLGRFLAKLAVPALRMRIRRVAPEVLSHHSWLKGEIQSKEVDKKYVTLDYADEGGRGRGLDTLVDKWRSAQLKERPGCFYIRGKYGSGKTWFCLHYADHLFRHEPTVHPLFIRLSQCECDPGGTDWSVNLEGCRRLTFLDLREIVAPGNVLLFLDGLDETIANVWDLLAKFRELRVPTIVTFRDSLFDGEEKALEQLKRWEDRHRESALASICSFTIRQQHELILAFKKSRTAAEALEDAIRKWSLGKWTQIPVVLRLLLSIPEEKLGDFKSMHHIYKLAFEHVCGDAETRWRLDPGVLSTFVEDVAWWMFAQGKFTFDPTKPVGDRWTSPSPNLELPLLFTLPNSRGEVEFCHRSFREYLAAVRLGRALACGSQGEFTVRGIYFEILQFLGDLIRYDSDEQLCWRTLDSWLKTPEEDRPSKETKQLRENCIRLLGQWRDAKTLELLVGVVQDTVEESEHRRDAIRSICRIVWGEDEETEGAKATEMGAVTAWAIRTDRRTLDVGPAKIRVSRYGSEAKKAAEAAALADSIPKVRELFTRCLKKCELGEVRINASFALIHSECPEGLTCADDVARLCNLVLLALKEKERSVDAKKQASQETDPRRATDLKEESSVSAMVAVNLWQAVRVAAFEKSQEAQQLLEEIRQCPNP